MTALLAGAGTVALTAGGWWLSLLRHPYAPCRWCRGTGRNPGSRRSRYGLCGHCDGNGRRLRAGARMARPDIRRK